MVTWSDYRSVEGRGAPVPASELNPNSPGALLRKRIRERRDVQQKTDWVHWDKDSLEKLNPASLQGLRGSITGVRSVEVAEIPEPTAESLTDDAELPIERIPTRRALQIDMKVPLATIDTTVRTMNVRALVDSIRTGRNGTQTLENLIVTSSSTTETSLIDAFDDAAATNTYVPGRGLGNSTNIYPITSTVTYGTSNTAGAIRYDPTTGATMNYGDDWHAWCYPREPFATQTDTGWQLVTPNSGVVYREHQQIRGRRARTGQLFASVSPEEIVALQLLRKMVPTDVFRRYLKDGFVTVPGPSGLVYQIFRDTHQGVQVWDKGQKAAYLCVHMKDKSIPPTDEVVAKMLIVELDEPDIWKRANATWSIMGPRQQELEARFAA